MRKIVLAHFTPFTINISDCALFFSSVYLCQQFVFKDNSFYKKRRQLLRQLLWVENSKTKIWKTECYLSELIFKFICLDKLQKQPTEVFHKIRCSLRCSIRKGVLKNFIKFTAEYLWQSLFFNKVADYGAGVFLWLLWNF